MFLKRKEITLNNDIIKEMFAECNHLYFCDTLPVIPINIIHSTTNYGELHFTIKENAFQDFYMNISDVIRTKTQLKNVIMHEMCHLAVFYKFTEQDIKHAIDNPKEFNKLLCIEEYAHSGEWLKLASSINKLYKLNIHLR